MRIFLFILWLFLSPFAGAADYNLHFQSTVVSQEHGDFPARYSGQNSLSPEADRQTSITWTVFAGHRLWNGAELYLNPELAGGSGFNRTQGIAGFPNAEIYRVDDPSPKWNLARLYLKQVLGLGGSQEEIKDDKNQLNARVDVKRVTVIAGKFSLNDFLDNNTYSHDPRTQFLNWALMDHGAWDYAADTRGYSWGLFFELNQPQWSVRLATVLVPVNANQLELDRDFPPHRGDNLEFEWRFLHDQHPGAIRLLAYENFANMGNYRNTLNTPSYQMDVAQSRLQSVKYGLGLNAEQSLSDTLGVFLRASWDDGHTETWAFTEIDQSFSVGLSLKGASWSRSDDTLGVAVLLNGLSDDHRAYLARGGYGFIIGDGQLNYAPEEIIETYYLLNLIKGLDMAGDYQFVNNPAYNADRGPVSIFSLRLHYEI